jgi:hypothetical protein
MRDRDLYAQILGIRGRTTAPGVPVEVWINRSEMDPTNNVPQAAAS